MRAHRFWIVILAVGIGIGRYVLPQAASARAAVVIQEPRRDNHVLAEVVRCATQDVRAPTPTPTPTPTPIDEETTGDEAAPEPDPGDGLTDDERWEGVVAELEDKLPAKVGAIQGQIRDAKTSEPLAGVTVITSSPVLTGAQTAITDENGHYVISGLPVGDNYLVTLYYADVTVERPGLAVTERQATPVFQRLQTGNEVTHYDRITADDGYTLNIPVGRTIDPDSTVQGITIDRNYIYNGPVPGRTFEATLGTSVDADDSDADNLGVSFSGGTTLENEYYIID